MRFNYIGLEGYLIGKYIFEFAIRDILERQARFFLDTTSYLPFLHRELFEFLLTLIVRFNLLTNLHSGLSRDNHIRRS
jgi:hypothetical protein